MDILAAFYHGRALGLEYTVTGEQFSIEGPQTPATLTIVHQLARHKAEVLTSYRQTCRYNELMNKPLLSEETQELMLLADSLQLPKPVIQRIHLGARWGEAEEIQPKDWRP